MVGHLRVTAKGVETRDVENARRTRFSISSEEIHELLHKNYIEVGENEELHAWVRITVNAENEIVVLSVTTDNEAIESLVKNRLNYHKLANSSLEEGKTYRVPIRFTS